MHYGSESLIRLRRIRPPRGAAATVGERTMQIAQLPAEKREAHGTKAARRLRKDGKLPAIVYGHGQPPEPVVVPIRELRNLVEHGAHLVELRVNGTAEQCLIKDVQFDHLGITPVHADFTRVDLNERVKVRVPFEFKG